MYDRKTWIVVIACSLLLAVNLHFSQKDAKARAEERARQAPQQVERPELAEGETLGILEQVQPESAVEAETVLLETEKTIFTLTSLGAGVATAELKDQQSVIDETKQVVLNEGSPNPVGALADGADRMETVNYQYREDQSEPGRTAVFLGEHPSGLLVKKIYSLVTDGKPGSEYKLNLEVVLENDRESVLPLDQFSLFLGRANPIQSKELTPSGFFWREAGNFHFTHAGKFHGGMFSKAKPLIIETAPAMDYAGVSSQLFATVLRPVETEGGGIWSKGYETVLKEGEKAVRGARAGYTLPGVTLEPGASRTFKYELFMGPKDNRMLRQMGEGWGEIMNYGWFSIFSRLMNWLLVNVHDLVSKVSDKWSWGFAIIIVTIIVRTAMWPLYAKSNRMQKRMGMLKPEMDRLKEKYPDDPAKMQQEVMGLYRKFGINPLGGCLPMFAQLPIFFGFYRMLQYAVELRGQGFLWVQDLSMPDTIGYVGGIPINILPMVMGLTSFIQMAMMPMPSADKTQQTIMKLMPLMFFIFCYNFASALALYWTTSNIFSIFQTWLTQRMPDPELKERPGAAGKKSFMERMAEAAEKQQQMKKAQGRVIEPEEPKKKRGPRTGG